MKAVATGLAAACLILATLANAAAPPTVVRATPAPEFDRLFERTEGWTGGDGMHTVALAPGKTLWLFGDTWVGKIKDNKHVDATMVNNTVVVQEQHGNEVKMHFPIRLDGSGKPAAQFTPADGKGWFWPQAGALVHGKLLLFLTQIERTSDPGVFGFRAIGLWLGVVENPLDDPVTWRLTQKKLPCALFSPKREINWGFALLADGTHLYIYGFDEDVLPFGKDRHLVVARTRLVEAADPERWEFFGHGGWHADFQKAERLANEMACDGSVIYLPHRQVYVLVYTQNSMSPLVRLRTAPQPWGPWSPPITLFNCPEMAQDKRLFCYNAKAHAHLSRGDELVISYVTNSMEFSHVVNNAKLYWPRFYRVKLGP